MNNKNKTKRQQRTVGAIVKIQLDEEYHTYARILGDACFAFYDSKTKKDITDMQEIASKPVLFITAVYNDAVTRGRWEKVGKLPLEEELQKLPKFFIQDKLAPGKFEIYENGEIHPATREECIGLESASVWEPEAIEERIRNHYDGVPNFYVEEDKKALKITDDFQVQDAEAA